MEERNVETTTCIACGESVLSTEKFCKNCGKPLGQKNEKIVVAENPNKKVVLTFEASDGGKSSSAWGREAKITYSIEVDGNFIGKINSGEKIDTFVTKGKRNIKIKGNKSFIPNEEGIWVEDNQTILLYSSYLFFNKYLTNPSDLEKEEMLQREKKTAKKTWLIILLGSLLLLLCLFLITNL